MRKALGYSEMTSVAIISSASKSALDKRLGGICDMKQSDVYCWPGLLDTVECHAGRPSAAFLVGQLQIGVSTLQYTSASD